MGSSKEGNICIGFFFRGLKNSFMHGCVVIRFLKKIRFFFSESNYLKIIKAKKKVCEQFKKSLKRII